MNADPRGRRILDQLAAKLDRLQELDATVRSQHLTVHNGSSELRSTATVTVSFRRPIETWNLQGTTTPITPSEPDSGAPFELRASGRSATLAVSIIDDGKPQPYRGVIPALEVMRGLTLDTANIVPDMLLHEPFDEPQWNPSRKPLLPYLAEHARFEREEPFDGHDCYRIQSVQETGTWTLWIDKASLVPWGVKLTIDGDQIKSSGLGLAGRITHMESTHHIELTHSR